MSFIQSRPNSSKKDMTLAGYRLIEIDSLSRRSMRVEPKESNKPLFHPMCPDGINFLIFFFFQSSQVAYYINLSYNDIIFCPLGSLDRLQSTAVLHPPLCSHQPTAWYCRSPRWTGHGSAGKVNVPLPSRSTGLRWELACAQLSVSETFPENVTSLMWGRPPLKGPPAGFLGGWDEGNLEQMLMVGSLAFVLYLPQKKKKKELSSVPISNYLITDKNHYFNWYITVITARKPMFLTRRIMERWRKLCCFITTANNNLVNLESLKCQL